ncbi:aspartate aminotransferase family protein [Denitromonas ohlonensis]|uniref:Acetylornithine aminotransferase n=2 Tax=Denitromonas TaxID=139331 RepID=A0A558EF02_9RHOO|nr:aspartate aminotransferase family protein [Denitromonas ohlonensis]TVT49175.1 MAG: aspartate aminotransferase family protein [Denitromonas halophila]TVO69116.1 aspartate aminotransferase family protein [Denitromonas ohlonensis]TVO77216.1 aspartate aminotransferase family protein [Denitromonas ohlonensis]TVT71996.1 MAG: aspartate aminotransferase family protein [Denitromonas halophila]TVT78160.1 MAG: aspartate aminotransferase family protein [Denitromonas halophila]
MSHVMNTYGRLPVAFSHGEGAYLFDTEGKRYLDALAGIAVSTLGHNHPDLVKALAEQAGRVLHTSNLYRIPAQEALADRLAELSQMDEVFFSNSGCEANEAAIKLARYYGHKRGVTQPAIVVMEQAFHGRTLATLSATGNRKVQAGFEPLVPGFIRVPFDNIAAVEQVAKANSDVVAVMLEPIQGEGGIRVAHTEYLKALRALCDAHQWLLIVDEVQCGVGRTGKWFGHQWSGIKPDVMTLAKGLGSGVPIGACLTAGRATGVFGPGNHGSTFGGNPLACTAGLTTIDVMLRDGLLDNAAARGVQLRDGMAAALDGVAGVVDIRGDGLMVGIELDRPCAELVGQALEAGLLINVTAERVIRLLPPLTFTDADVTALIDALAPLVRKFLSA